MSPTSAAAAATPRSTAPSRTCSAIRGRTRVVEDFVPWGGDERQFCSPGFDLPVGALTAERRTGCSPSTTRRPTTSTWSRRRASPTRSTRCWRSLDVLDRNAAYSSRSPYGEPQLGRRGLYGQISAGRPAGRGGVPSRDALGAEPRGRRALAPGRRRARGAAVRGRWPTAADALVEADLLQEFAR